MSERGGWWSPGSARSRRSGWASTGCGTGSGDGARRSAASRASIPTVFKSPDRRRGRRISSPPTTSRSAAPGGSTALASSPSPRPGMALADAELDLAREDPERVGAMMGTALGGVAYGERNYHAFLTEGPRAVDPGAGAHRLRRRGELQHRDRVRLHRPEQHQRDELRVGHDRHRRRLPRHRPGRRRRDDRRRRRGAARAALLRRVRDHPRDVHAQRRPGARQPPVRRGPRRLRDGRGRRGAGAGGAGPRAGARARRSTPRSAGTA